MFLICQIQSIPAQVLNIIDVSAAWLSNKFWLLFCEVKIVQDPSNYRHIDQVLKNGDFSFHNEERRSSNHHKSNTDEATTQEDGERGVLTRTSSKASMKTFPKKVKSSFEQARRRSIEAGSQSRKGKSSISMVDVYGMSEDRRSMVFSPATGAERRRRNSEMSNFLSPRTNGGTGTNRERAVKGKGRWSGNYDGNYSPTGNPESPLTGFHYHCHLIDGFEPDCGPDKRILILS